MERFFTAAESKENSKTNRGRQRMTGLTGSRTMRHWQCLGKLGCFGGLWCFECSADFCTIGLGSLVQYSNQVWTMSTCGEADLLSLFKSLLDITSQVMEKSPSIRLKHSYSSWDYQTVKGWALWISASALKVRAKSTPGIIHVQHGPSPFCPFDLFSRGSHTH